MSTVSNSVEQCQQCNSVNIVNSVNSYSAVLPPSPMVFLITWTMLDMYALPPYQKRE